MDKSAYNGRMAEEASAQYLEAKGYEIVARNYRCRGGEIDIIAQQHSTGALLRRITGRDAGFIVFVEVKQRTRSDFGEPREAVTERKREKIRLAAMDWLGTHGSKLQPRFDVIEVKPGESGPVFNHIENAF